MAISPNPINVEGGQVIGLFEPAGGSWSSNVGSFYLDAAATIPYTNQNITSVYFKAFNRTAVGTVQAGGGPVVANVIGVLPDYPNYPLEWTGGNRGAVISISRSGRVKGRIVAPTGYMRDYKIVYNNRTPAIIRELEEFHESHYPDKIFKYKNLWYGIEGYFRFDSEFKGKAEGRSKGIGDIAIAQVPYP